MKPIRVMAHITQSYDGKFIESIELIDSWFETVEKYQVLDGTLPAGMPTHFSSHSSESRRFANSLLDEKVKHMYKEWIDFEKVIPIGSHVRNYIGVITDGRYLICRWL